MGTRIELHEVLTGILGSDNVYFQPPENLSISYPCIIYSLSKVKVDFADDSSYMANKNYTVTLIDKNPDTQIFDLLVKTLRCSVDNIRTVNNLNHYTLSLYY